MEQAQQNLGNWVMEFHLVRGSFLSADDAAATEVAMDASVWGKLPEELVWEVVRWVPAAQLFRLHLVNRKWRQVLTSAAWRTRLPQAKEEEERHRAGVVACVWTRPQYEPYGDDRSVHGFRVLRFKMATLVPRWFWRRDWFGVKAAGHGLICISNDCVLPLKPERVAEANGYCVVNPLTRTCVVLPPVPFHPHSWSVPSSSTVAIWGASNSAWLLATYDLAAAGTGGGGGVGAGDWVLAHKPVPTPSPSLFWEFRGHGGAVLGGKTYWYTGQDNRVQVTAAGGAEEVGALAGPSAALLGLDEALFMVPGRFDRALLTVHRGDLFLVAGLRMRLGSPVDAVCGVWRLARRRGGQGEEERVEWEGVARLDRPELERIAGADGPPAVELHDAYGLRELVCCHFMRVDRLFGGFPHNRVVPLVGFNLDTLTWEMLYNEQNILYVPWAFELRPDLFLPS